MEIGGTSSKKQEMNNNENQISVDVDVDKLAKSLNMELETLHPLSGNCCIYRVPEKLREVNEKAYTPQVVSIGPLHHGKPELRLMEEHKRRYLKDFLGRNNKLTLQDLINATGKNEIKLKECYAETIDIPKEEFIKIMLVDSIFIIEYFLKIHFKNFRSNDRVLGKQKMDYYIRDDLLLLENQVPFFFLAYLLSRFDHKGLSMIKLFQAILACHLGIEVANNNISSTETIFQVQHLVDFLRISMLPSEPHSKKQYGSLSTPTITHLHRAGVKLKSSSSKCLLDIKFKNGILEIPKWIITDSTEILFRNIQAFEQCHDFCEYITEYIYIMDFLINNQEDVELLVKNGIIENWLENNQAVATFINNLGKQTAMSGNNFYFSSLCEDLTAYCKITRHKWKATLNQKYFNNPWTIISVIAATFLIILTVIQTICSIVQVV